MNQIVGGEKSCIHCSLRPKHVQFRAAVSTSCNFELLAASRRWAFCRVIMQQHNNKNNIVLVVHVKKNEQKIGRRKIMHSLPSFFVPWIFYVVVGVIDACSIATPTPKFRPFSSPESSTRACVIATPTLKRTLKMTSFFTSISWIFYVLRACSRSFSPPLIFYLLLRACCSIATRPRNIVMFSPLNLVRITTCLLQQHGNSDPWNASFFRPLNLFSALLNDKALF